MEDEEKLTAVLGILENYWSRFTADLSNEQLSNLKSELSGLADKMKSAHDTNDITNASKTFFDTLSTMKPLEFLAQIDKPQSRGGSLPEMDSEIKIKIINYCVMLQDRIDESTANTINR
jgi:hypothetical protein